jgi:hypothetical protein
VPERIDLTGRRVGRWNVIEYLGGNDAKHNKYRCECDCGAVKDILSFTLRSGGSKSCGCLQRDRASEVNAFKHTDIRFGRLLAIRRIGKDRNRNAIWLCRCDCGNEASVMARELKSGRTKSCGCFRAEIGKRVAIHGQSGTKTYKIWKGMHNRCTNEKQAGWENYGGRGIEICERWLDFSNFVSDMGEAPEGHSIDRIDCNGNYEPGNCRWATAHQQAANKRNSRNRFVIFEGREMVLKDAINHLCFISYLKTQDKS